LQEAPYLYHEPANGMSQRELIDQGFDPEQIKKLPTYVLPQSGKSGEQQARDTVLESNQSVAAESTNKPNRRIRPRK
jgi:hypothetical protein